MQSHKLAAEAVATSAQHYPKHCEPFRIFHASTNSTRQTSRRRQNTVDISSLSRVLEVNVEARSALVESNVPMDRLVERTLKHGLIPTVVMEFPGITTGETSQAQAGRVARSSMAISTNQ